MFRDIVDEMTVLEIDAFTTSGSRNDMTPAASLSWVRMMDWR